MGLQSSSTIGPSTRKKCFTTTTKSIILENNFVLQVLHGNFPSLSTDGPDRSTTTLWAGGGARGFDEHAELQRSRGSFGCAGPSLERAGSNFFVMVASLASKAAVVAFHFSFNFSG